MSVRPLCAVVLLLLAAFAVPAAPPAPPPGRGQPVFVPKTRMEKAAVSFLNRYSEKEIRDLQGFFAPVVRKWTPTGEKFSEEYLVATNKSMVISRYLPKARQVVEDARRMKLPPKYEQQRQRYITIAETFLSMVSLYLRFENRGR